MRLRKVNNIEGKGQMEAIIQVRDVTKTFVGKDNKVEALKGINLDIHKGEIYGIIGMSARQQELYL